MMFCGLAGSSAFVASRPGGHARSRVACHPKHLSVRCEAAHFGATRFAINKWYKLLRVPNRRRRCRRPHAVGRRAPYQFGGCIMRKTFLVISSLVLSLTIADPLGATDAQKKSSPPSDSLVQDILAWLPANFDLPTGNIAPAIKFLSKNGSRQSVTTASLRDMTENLLPPRLLVKSEMSSRFMTITARQCFSPPGGLEQLPPSSRF